MANIKRSAFIIISDESINYGKVRGGAADLVNYTRYLKSDIGGAWRDDEIHTLRNPTRRRMEISFIAHGSESDYSLIIFSGHGGTNRVSGEIVACINDDEDIEVDDMHTKASRQLIILDSCRTFYVDDADLEEMRKSASRRWLLEDRTDAMFRAQCRILYNSSIMNADTGTSYLFGCSEGEGADDTANGGLFSKNLIRCAELWANSQPHFSGYGGKQLVYSILSAYKCTVERLKNKQQNPDLINGRRRYCFPFAVCP